MKQKLLHLKEQKPPAILVFVFVFLSVRSGIMGEKSIGK